MADERGLTEAVSTLLRGGLVAFPTETVYGLSCIDPSKIFAAKGRSDDKPLALFVTREMADEIAHVPEELMRFWPGPLTIVAERKSGEGSVGLRMPDHPVALELLRRVGRPLATTSANSSGKPSPKCAEDVLADLGEKIDVVIDGGICPIGIESTVVDVTKMPFVILRQGTIRI